jgi:hypothetical protein
MLGTHCERCVFAEAATASVTVVNNENRMTKALGLVISGCRWCHDADLRKDFCPQSRASIRDLPRDNDREYYAAIVWHEWTDRKYAVLSSDWWSDNDAHPEELSPTTLWVSR